MEYLKIYGLNDDDIKRILELNDELTIKDFVVKEDQISRIIDYLLDIGVKDIYPYLVYRSDFIYENLQDVVSTFHNFGVDKAVKLLNESIDNLDLIYYHN